MSRARFRFVLVTVVAALLLAGPASGESEETPIVVRVTDGGFQWSDAGIGAVAGAGIAVAVLGGVALGRTRGVGENPRSKGRQS